MADDTSASSSPNNSDYIAYLKSLLGKASQAAVSEGNEGTLQQQSVPEGYGAAAQGLPSDPGASAGAKPEGSPIDIIAGGAGGKLGSAMASDAGAVLGNEVGSIGSNIGKKIAGEAVDAGIDAGAQSAARSASPTATVSVPSSMISQPTQKFAPLLKGEGSGLIQKFQDLHPSFQGMENGNDLLANANAISKRATETGMKNPVTPDMLTAIKQRIASQSSRDITNQTAQDAMKKQVLGKLAGQEE